MRSGTIGTEWIPCQFDTVLNSLGPVIRSQVVSFWTSGSSDICNAVQTPAGDRGPTCALFINSSVFLPPGVAVWRTGQNADEAEGHKATTVKERITTKMAGLIFHMATGIIISGKGKAKFLYPSNWKSYARVLCNRSQVVAMLVSPSTGYY